MKMRNLICLLLAVIIVVTLLGSCASQQNTAGQPVKSGKDGKIAISMYMWDRSMFKELTPWLEQKFPDIEFTFVQSF